VNIESTTTATARSDSALIKRAQLGDSDAFATLFHTHKMRIYSLCFRMTNNATEAEDLAQDAFLQVFRKLASFRGDSALSTWLYRIAVNTVLTKFHSSSGRLLLAEFPHQVLRMISVFIKLRGVNDFVCPERLRREIEFCFS
jgi:DNA-directed RNA polymerase specialized sigma24 family protein